MSELENETSSKAEEQNLLIEQLRSEASALNTRSDENHKCYEVEVSQGTTYCMQCQLAHCVEGGSIEGRIFNEG